MSRVAKAPIHIPRETKVEIKDQLVNVCGAKGCLEIQVHPTLSVVQKENQLNVIPIKENVWAMAGTTRALLNNMIIGCTVGFTRKLTLVGVGYRAQKKDNILNLSLGYSHVIEYNIPQGIQITVPTQTEIVVMGADKQQVGQVAAEIRSFRPPEPYKGKGVRYSDEIVLRKEAKKK